MNPKLKKFFKISLIICILMIGLFFIFTTSVGVWLINKKSYAGMPQELVTQTTSEVGAEAQASENLAESVAGSSTTQVSYDKTKVQAEINAFVDKYKSNYQEDKKDPVKAAIIAIQALNFFEKVGQDMKKTATAPLCNFVCNKSVFDESIADSVGIPYLEDFYRQEKNRSFEDFEFRLATESLSQIAKIVSPEFRDVFLKGLIAKQENKMAQISYIVQMQYQFAKSISKFNQYSSDFDRIDKTMDSLKAFRAQCDNQPEDVVQQQCEKALAEGPILISVEE